MKRTLLSLLLATTAGIALAQDGFSTLEERMTGKEFTAAGLDKLSEEELKALNQWLRARSVATLDTPQSSGGYATTSATASGDLRGFEDQALSNISGSDIESRVIGKFDGWDGDTIFILENGMIWQQAESGRFHIAEVENPAVEIKQGLMKVWNLRVKGYNKSVKVERIQ